MISIEKEPEDISKEFGDLVENCIFCNQPTRFWHNPTNRPVCPKDAKIWDEHNMKVAPFYY